MWPAVEEMLISVPAPLATSAGISAWVTSRVPITLTSYMWRHTAGSASVTCSSPKAPPALLTSRSSRSPTADASASTWLASVTSHVTAVPPISSASASIRSVRRATQNTWNPASASARAVASPMPLLAPVTTASG